jgi:hypothetical protein
MEVWEGAYDGKGSIGRPRRKLEDSIKMDLKK